jgi:hypothetical protein
MSDSRGYSTALVQQVAAADPSLPTIRLAKVCIDRGVSVWEVSRKLGVSRPIIYRWFSGKTIPRTKHLEQILILVSQLESA